jgi:peptidyl-prolyl cis-trans isomerase SurA
MKKIALTLIVTPIMACSFAQTVFTYGNHAVSKDEFIRAFNKNPSTNTDRKKALQEYLNLYTNFKLKVQAAYDAGLDKDKTQQDELQNFKMQIAENIINEQANVKELVKEAFNRSQKDIHLAQVFIPVTEKGDTTEAYKKIQAAYQALKEGKDFAKVSEEFSTDADTKQTGGDLGFITVFTLPYEFENIAYSLRPNTFSAPYRSKLGYHIFKNVGERKPLGRRKVAQVVIAFPPNATDAEKSVAARKADSVYNLIKKGAGFEELARTVSNDLSSNANNGVLAEFGIGTYSPEFEQVAFSLKNVGEVSKPFITSHGYHILKLLEAKPVSADMNDVATTTFLQEKVNGDERLLQAKKGLLGKELKIINYKPSPINQKNLFEFTDSAVAKSTPVSVKGVNDNTVLFSFGKTNIKAADWVRFVRGVRGLPGYASKDMNSIYQEFLQVMANDYYKNHLQDYNEDYKKQVAEFKDANLLFGVMEKNVWGKANVDTTGLHQYYNEHKVKYTWGPSADGLIITAANEAIANEVKSKLSNNLSNWRSITESYGTQIAADSGRYELSQLPVVDRTNFTDGLITAPVKNVTDGTVTFNYIIRVHNQPGQRSFEDARGMIVSDYQQVLEDKWIAELRKKYPVKINTAVFNSIK